VKEPAKPAAKEPVKEPAKQPAKGDLQEPVKPLVPLEKKSSRRPL
jgi:hypothetical protein